ncbi:MAG: hypothetical protein ACXAC5_03800 [Promethearchaeota archaeon]
MSEPVEARVTRYETEYPQDRGRWYYDNYDEHMCSKCGDLIERDTAFVHCEPDEFYCEDCVLGVDTTSTPEYKEPFELPNWMIRSNGVCYFCGVGNCDHTKKAIG